MESHRVRHNLATQQQQQWILGFSVLILWKISLLFDRAYIKSVGCLGQYIHFNNINHSNSRAWISLHFCVSSSFSFINVLLFSEYRPFTYSVKFIPMYFILFHLIFNDIIFLTFFFWYFIISVQMCNRFLYINLKPATLLNSFISFWVEILGFSMWIVTI